MRVQVRALNQEQVQVQEPVQVQEHVEGQVQEKEQVREKVQVQVRAQSVRARSNRDFQEQVQVHLPRHVKGKCSGNC